MASKDETFEEIMEKVDEIIGKQQKQTEPVSEQTNTDQTKPVQEETMAEPVETVEPKKQSPELSPKSIELMKKVETLIKKVEQEKNPIKQHLLSFKLRMLRGKIQKELDLQNIKEEYETKREMLKTKKEERDQNSIDEIAKLVGRIESLRRQIESNEEYDYESPEFMYPKKLVSEVGGIEQFADSLKGSSKLETQLAADRIKSISKKREELKELKDKLKSEKDKLDDSEINHGIAKRDLDMEEKALTITNKFNILSGIKSFFNNIKEEWADFKAEREENKRLKAQEKEDMDKALKEYNMQKASIQRYYEGVKEQMNEQRRSQKAEEFRAGMEVKDLEEPVKQEEPEQAEQPEKQSDSPEPTQEQSDEERE